MLYIVPLNVKADAEEIGLWNGSAQLFLILMVTLLLPGRQASTRRWFLERKEEKEEVL